MIFVIYPSDETLAEDDGPSYNLKIVHVRDQANMDARMASFLREDPDVLIYRVIEQGKDLVLKRVRMKPNTGTYESRLMSAQFEDDV